MNKLARKYIAAITGSVCLSIAGAATAGWEVYDNFNSGSIDTSKWNVDDDTAAIAVTGGSARFSTYPNMFDNSAWLSMTQDVQNIKGIRAKVLLKSGCAGTVRARVGAATADLPGPNYLFSWHALQSNGDSTHITSSISEITNSDSSYIRDRLWGYSPGYGDVDITGKWVVITMFYDKPHNQRFWSNYDGQTDGEIRKKMSTKPDVRPTSTVPVDNRFAAIGTRTRDNGTGDGSCRAWFDWVQVFK